MANDNRAMIEAGCRILGIELEPAWLDTIGFNVRVIEAQAGLLLTPPIPDHAEPGPVFTA